jgi:hypothetical protein
MRKFIIICFVLLPFGLYAQNIQGDWLLAYIVSIPPEMTMGEDGVDLVMGDTGSEAESFVEQGLMMLSIKANNKATSFYADVREEWNVVQNGRQVTFQSEADTLFGKLNQAGMLQLRSVIDEFPSEYYFTPYQPNPIQLSLSNSRWIVADDGVLDGKTLEFKSDIAVRIWTDGKGQDTDYFLVPLGDYYAIELSSPDFMSGFTIIYLESLKGDTLNGVMYVVGQDQPPIKVSVRLKKL